MIEVVSVKFKNRGKSYSFDPKALEIKSGDKVVVETAKGLEMGECCRGNHRVENETVVQPLRPVVRIATAEDLRVDELNRVREREAFQVCKKKIAEHGLDMKLVAAECSFEGNKTTFFFTSDGRVDFRELVKDLAGIFRNRIELRQIGVRDEAKMIGGLGPCGRPYCCSKFLDEFQPVSTKMAKVQSLSLNPTKISGSCGRLMCCLRYEEEAYEELLKRVPKQGAFVETKDGYGTAVQVNLLRQTVKVQLDGEGDDNLRVYKANELAAVPGGRPKDGETPPSVLKYVPAEEEEDEEEKVDEWAIPAMIVSEPSEWENAEAAEKNERPEAARRRGGKPRRENKGARRQTEDSAAKAESAAEKDAASRNKRNDAQGKASVHPVKAEAKEREKDASSASNGKPRYNKRRRYYRGKSRPKGGGE